MTVDVVKEYLENEGYRPKFDSDGDLEFRVEGLNFLYFANTNDQSFFQLVLPAVFRVTDENRLQALEACNAVARELKVAKAGIVKSDNVWLYFEMLLDSEYEIADIMPRALNILLGARRTFAEHMQK